MHQLEPFETDESAATPPPHPAYRVTARISIRDETPISLPPREEVERLLAMPTPSSSLLSLWSSPLPQIPSPLLPVSSPVPMLSPSPPTSPIRLLGYRAAMIRLRAEAASTSHSLPLPPPIIPSHTRPDAPPSGTPPLHLLSADHRADRPEVTLPPRKRLGIALGPRYEVGESLSATAARPTGGLRADYGFVATIDKEIMRDLERDVGYGITDTWDEMLVDKPGAPATDDTEMGRRMIEITTRVRQDTYEIYTRLDDEQSELGLTCLIGIGVHMLVLLGSWRLRPGCLERLGDDLWMRAADRRRHALITKILAADRRRQKQFIEALKLLKRLQTQMIEFKRQQGPAKGLAQPDAPEEAGSSS
ncbi:hypothetical protein Tco_0679830 [Tanacetum coccineum]|uniref:Uncharacterized protein n=1 Tax=Tanacetum coccineum TaxID=301880 RepID=A0ABQ4XK87_9ASTR